MKIQQVTVHHFRSIQDASLKDIGNFNVLIGRNNSGKSNLLFCLDLFFSSLRPGDVIVEHPHLGDILDFHNRILTEAIDITVFFSLTLAERDELLRDIVSEVPEMKNAVEGLDPTLWLSASIHVSPKRTPSEDPVVYIRRLALVSPKDLAANKPAEKRIILDAHPEAAAQLYTQRQTSRRLRKKKGALQRFLERVDADDWERIRTAPRDPAGSSAAFRHYMMRDFMQERDAITTLQAFLNESSSYEELKNAVDSEIASLDNEARETDEIALNHKIATVTGEVTKVPTYARKLLGRIAELKVLHLRERRKPIGAEEAQKLLDFKVRRGGPDVLRSIQEIVQSLLGVQVDAFAAEQSAARPGVRPAAAELDVDNFLVEANGAGIREALRIVLDFEFEHPDVLLIEEPEIHLHPALETSMLRYLKRVSSTCQVFITTHSTNFLDASDLGNVYLVSKSDSTNIDLLTRDDVEEQIPKELGIRMSSLFMFDRLVFVEGKSDEAIFRELAVRIGANFSNANAGFVVMGGARTFTHFAAEATLSFLAKRRVKCWFVIDRDERDDEDVVKMKERLGDRGILSTLNKREIENYLLVPRTLAEYLRERKGQQDPGADVDEITGDVVRQELNQIADELKELAVCKHIIRRLCGPNFSDLDAQEAIAQGGYEAVKADFTKRMKRMTMARDRLDEVAESVRRDLEDSWDMRKLDLVPGEEMLQTLFGRRGLAFKKDRDGPALAGLMLEGEVHQDLRTIITAVAQEVS